MLTHTSIGIVRGIISQSAAAAERRDRLVDRMHKADLLAAVGGQRQVHPAPRDEQELDDLAPLGATRMTAPLERLRSTLSDLSAEARREVQAIAMIGAGEFTAREWDAALLAAETRQTEAEPQAMAEDADLARHLSKGLYVLRLTQPAAGEHDTAASVHDPGDAVPPGVAPVEPVALTTQDRAVLGRLRDLPQRAAAPGVERGKTTLVHDPETGSDPASLAVTYRPANQGDRIMSDKVQGMAREVAGRAQQAFGGAVGDAKTQAQGVYNQASGQAQEQAARLAEIIRDQPLTATVIALGIGYIVGRLTG